MKKYKRILFWACLIAAGLLGSATLVWGQVSADYDLTWHVIGSGGDAVTSADYHVEWTAGQPLVGAADNDAHLEETGYWAGIVSTATPTVMPTAAPTATPTVTPAVTPAVPPETTNLFLPKVSN